MRTVGDYSARVIGVRPGQFGSIAGLNHGHVGKDDGEHSPLSSALECGQNSRWLRDANGQALAYIYSRDNEDEARQAKVLTKDEARRIAVNLARLPELLGKAD